jgi:arylsulfate sulfotransferase
MWPDWTHTNAILYSPDDGNLIVSIRHQNWLVKIDYEDGKGSGEILWRLGYQGDFALVGGTDPVDWFYAQHAPSFVSSNTSGTFTLTLFDNGDDRVFPFGCDKTGEPNCFYSTVPIFQIDEQSKTATLVSHLYAPYYNSWGGNAEVLQNGDLEFCETFGRIYEMTQGGSPQTELDIAGQLPYRGKRIPSLYPGIQW